MNTASRPGEDTARDVVVHRERGGAALVTVAVSLHDYRDYVVSCLESVRAQTIRDLDLVIVDDYSGDGGDDVARHWLEENGERFCRCLLVRHQQNEGLAAARNTAFAHARTEPVFVLDADNLLYPRCLEQLAAALSHSGASFAYGYLEKFGDLAGLHNLRPWNPEALQHGNSIDAMVLLRRNVWQAVGGYSHDMPAMGWEDFELWFKIARMGGWGIQVPEILARYCVHRDSMLQTVTNPQMASLWEYLRSKYREFFAEPRLAAGHSRARSIPLWSDGATAHGEVLDRVTTARVSHSDEPCEMDCGLLEESGLLDVTIYGATAGVNTRAQAAKHYLLAGWRANLEPNPNFDGRFLYPYYRSAGFDGPPALTFIKLRAAGWPVYATRAEAEATAKVIGASPLFDAVGYAARAGGLDGLDPALHYVLVGDQMGLAPSPGFDPGYYRDRNPDVSDAVINRLGHYLAYGRAAGRRPISVAETLTFDRRRMDASRETILLIVDEASCTDASTVAYNIALRLRHKYNVIAVLLAAGELSDDFETCCAAVVGPIPRSEWCEVEAKHLVARLCASYRVLYAIANSIETRMMLPSLAHAHVPVVTLVHEFASYTRPAGTMGRALDWSTHVVFPAGLVADSAEHEHPTLRGRTIHVLPPGPCPTPSVPGVPAAARNGAALLEVSRQKAREHALLVFGCGAVHIRKGLDLFLSCAAAVAGLTSKRPVRFVWVGGGYQPNVDASYSCYLADQIERAGLGTTVSIIDTVDDMEPAYAMADVLFLSSRLDPLPNVAIGAALRGIPVVCFEHATGMADILATDALASLCAVPYLDVTAAAGLMVALADNERNRAEIGAATRRVAAATFDMDRYVCRLDELGIDAARIMQKRTEDFITLQHDPLFDASVYLHPHWPTSTRDEAISEFLARWLAVGTHRHPASNGLFRRPCVGFHPQIYAHEKGDRFDTSCVNPLAHFIRHGKPEGAWCHEVIVPGAVETAVAVAELKVALHAHFFYPELAADMLRRLSANQSRCDLLLTTDDERKARLIGEAARRYDRGKVLIRLVPNRGRDIGALLTALADDLLSYDVIGHVHGKRSVHIDSGAGDSWREFLWQHVIGDCHPMMDLILGRFARDRGLGIVFPDDPHLPDWDANEDAAARLATRMGIAEPLPPFFDFPVGTMFWARTDALRPLLALRLDWLDYPTEPVPADGTILHALERVLPFAARHAGYRYATTHVPGITWAL